MVAGLVQLLILAPTLDFGPIAWIFHLVLTAAALILARRDAALLPAAVAAACLVTVLVAAGLLAPELAVTPVAAAVATAMLGGSGFAWSRRAAGWAGIALIGLAGPVLVAHACSPGRANALTWSVLEIAAAAIAAALAWRHRDRAGQRDVGLVAGTAVAALLGSVALAGAAGWDWAPLALAPVLLALGGWAQRIDDRDLARLPAAHYGAMLLLPFPPLLSWASLIAHAIAGTELTYPLLPSPGDVARMVALPALAAAALLGLPRPYGTVRRLVIVVLAVVGIACLYTLAKQPLAIASDARFVTWGFAERAAVTLAFAASGWALASLTRYRRIGMTLVCVALARFAWFDMIVHNPVQALQQVGSLPLLNLAVLLPALLALATWAMGRDQRWRWATLALALIATGAGVRQAAHGGILTGPMGTAENWGYSAAFLALATLWLWRGLVTHTRTLRIAALALLTLVTIKVFLIDVAALGGLLRILSFLGLGFALIGIGWAYNRLIVRPVAQPSP